MADRKLADQRLVADPKLPGGRKPAPPPPSDLPPDREPREPKRLGLPLARRPLLHRALPRLNAAMQGPHPLPVPAVKKKKDNCAELPVRVPFSRREVEAQFRSRAAMTSPRQFFVPAGCPSVVRSAARIWLNALTTFEAGR